MNGGNNRQSLSIVGSEINLNKTNGIWIKDSGIHPIGEDGITGNEIKFNGKGIVVGNDGRILEINGNDIDGNGTEIEMIGDSTLIANNNYFGDFTTQELQDGKVNLTKFSDSRDPDRIGIGSILINQYATRSVTDGSPTQTESFDRPLPVGVDRIFQGSISGSETWSGTILLTGDVTITETGILTILPGTEILMDYGIDINASGMTLTMLYRF